MNQYFLDVANGADCLGVSACLPTGTEYAENSRVLPRQTTRRQGAARCNANTLNDAVRENRQRFAGLGGKEQHQTDPFISWCICNFVFDDTPSLFLPLNNVGVETQRHHLLSGETAFHCLETVDAASRCPGQI